MAAGFCLLVQNVRPLKKLRKQRNCGQYFVNLLAWRDAHKLVTVSQSIRRLRDLEARFENGEINQLTKRDSTAYREKEKLESTRCIKEMGGIPDMLFIIDTNKEAIAVQEANRLGIPVVAVVDSNAAQMVSTTLCLGMMTR